MVDAKAARAKARRTPCATTDFRSALERFESEPKLAKKFIEDPESTLELMGVDTSNLIIQRNLGVGRSDVSDILDGVLTPQLTVCASVGFIVCATVGGEV